jgi:hypothetical protein
MRVLSAAAAAIGLTILLAGCGTTPGPAGTHPARTSAHAGECRADQQGPAMPWAGPGALTGVQFVSSRRGWVVGLGEIIATTDGGRHWNTQLKGDLGLASVDFVDGSHGWAVGSRHLLVTTDGGSHWAALPEPCPEIRQVHFVSPQVGFAIAGGIDLFGTASPLAPLRRGVLLTTSDGGRTWHRATAPADAQSVCFGSPKKGWLGADGGLFRTADGGRTWQPTSARVRSRNLNYPALMTVQCAGADSAWAQAIGPGGEMSQEPHVGFHAGPRGTAAIFAEQYFQNPGSAPHANSSGSYAGPFSAISPAVAAFIDWCVACGAGTAPWELAVRGGATLRREGNVKGLNIATGASFVSQRQGWILGAQIRYGPSGASRMTWRVVSTSDGGRSWRVVYTEER